MDEDRLDSLMRIWDVMDPDDEDYQEWYEGLSEEERALVDAWDTQYEAGVLRLCQDILANEHGS